MCQAINLILAYFNNIDIKYGQKHYKIMDTNGIIEIHSFNGIVPNRKATIVLYQSYEPAQKIDFHLKLGLKFANDN